MIQILKRLRSIAFLIVFLLISNVLNADTLFENFDNPSVAATNNNGVAITYNSGLWFSYGIKKPTKPTENDRINGLYSIRMRGLDGKNSLYMQFDKAGAGTLSFVYGSYSNHSDGEFTVQKSTDGGSSWQTIGDPVSIPKWSGTFHTYSLAVNYSGNIRFKIVATLRTPNNPNQQFNIDDFMITDYGTNQAEKPVSTVSTGVYESSQTVSLSSATAEATIYYTMDGTEPNTSSNIYTIPLSVNTTTLIKAMAV